MKYVKILGPLAVAAAALMAFAGSASATTITSPTGTVLGSTTVIHAVNEGGHVKLANPVANIECSSTVEGKISTQGAGVTAEGAISTLDFTGCTNSWHVTTISPGTLIAHWTSGYNGTLTSSGAKVETTRLGVKCVYVTANTEIGAITGGNPATLAISAKIPLNQAESSALCGEGSAAWSGGYTTTSALYLDSEGGGGEGGSVDIEPSSKKFKFTEWQNFRIKNTGPGSATINNLTLSITKGTGSAFVVEDPNGCIGKTLSSGGSCEVRVTCNEWEAHGKLTVDTSAGSPSATFNSTP